MRKPSRKEDNWDKVLNGSPDSRPLKLDAKSITKFAVVGAVSIFLAYDPRIANIVVNLLSAALPGN